MAFDVIVVVRDTFYWTHFDALRRIKVADAFSAELGLDNINFYSFRNGSVGALGFADITINAFVCNN